MQFTFSKDDELFREEVRDWLAEHTPREERPRGGTEMLEFDLAWQKAKYEGGWGAISWPKEYGGGGLTPVQQMIWTEEVARARAPGVNSLNVALTHAGPTLIGAGSEEQKLFHLSKILKGELIWCQGFSEPESGSDLASLKTRAVVDGDELVITGHKTWTTHAQHATYQEMLVRTDPALGKHRGITWIIVDMRSRGITIRPIDTLAGDQHYSEVFYDGVRVPRSNIVGELHGGWKVAMSTLTAERSGAAASNAFEALQLIQRLYGLAENTVGSDGQPLIRNGDFAARLAQHRAEGAALRAMTCATISRAMRDEAPGPESAMSYLYFGELLQRIRSTALDLLGAGAIELDSQEDWVRKFLFDRMYTIAGGTTEIRRNIIAERILDLPRSF
jgi:alkylation response protein AidB-like acyl-CoA dehydrogenase